MILQPLEHMQEMEREIKLIKSIDLHINNGEDYKIEDYRKNIYPFNSTEYLSYLNKSGPFFHPYE